MSWRPDGWKNPYHKTGDLGQGMMAWNEQPEFNVYEAGADAMHKADIEWMMEFRHDCLECGWTITPERDDWLAFIREAKE